MTVEQQSFWQQRWQTGQTGWHLPKAHGKLLRLLPSLDLKPGSRILVPLCGKTVDMRLLCDRGHAVTGVDFCREAFEGYFSEQFGRELPDGEADQGGLVFRGENLELVEGDFFAFRPARLFDLIYDRAALFAISPDLRPQYRDQLLRCLQPEGCIVLIALEYPQNQLQGPPYSLTAPEIRELFESSCEIREIERQPVETTRVGPSGPVSMTETASVLRLRQA